MGLGRSRILVTGATGFVGRALCAEMQARGEVVVAATRSRPMDAGFSGQSVLVPDLIGGRDWSSVLDGVDSVVHLAARVHVMRDRESDPLAAFRQVNVQGTERLARAASSSGVRRFIYISSIKVNGESTAPGRPFTSLDTPAPRDAYGISKHEAESALLRIAEETGLEVVVIRPPLIYGAGVKANFHSMMQWVQRGVPLPLGAIGNRRSLVALDNLVDLIAVCLRHPQAPGNTFLASDGEDLSTTDLLRRAAAALGVRARLIPVPAGILRAAAALVGKVDFAGRLLDSLQVDISDTKSILGWSPPVGVDEALRSTARNLLMRS